MNDGRFAVPKLIVSRCLGFDACRWNGAIIHDERVERITGFVVETVCPEVDAGFGVPREPMVVVAPSVDDVNPRLVQVATGLDVTPQFARFLDRYFADREMPDGVILKSGSPSCGLNDAKVYPRHGRVAALGRGPGLFARALLARWPTVPVQSEARLENGRIRRHFLTVLFLRASFREARARGTMDALVRFHARNKLLLMAYHQTLARRLGVVVANHERLPAPAVFDRYERLLAEATARPPRAPAVVNALQHAFGYVSQQLDPRERAFLIELIEQFRTGRVGLEVPVAVLGSHIARFDVEYLAGQTLFAPYPGELEEPVGEEAWRPPLGREA